MRLLHGWLHELHGHVAVHGRRDGDVACFVWDFPFCLWDLLSTACLQDLLSTATTTRIASLLQSHKSSNTRGGPANPPTSPKGKRPEVVDRGMPCKLSPVLRQQLPQHDAWCCVEQRLLKERLEDSAHTCALVFRLHASHTCAAAVVCCSVSQVLHPPVPNGNQAHSRAASCSPAAGHAAREAQPLRMKSAQRLGSSSAKATASRVTSSAACKRQHP